MKNLYSVLGIALAASLSIISCTKDPVAPAEIVSGEGVPFEISTLITKTSNDGLNTKWAAEDQINLFHAEAGTTTYVNDNSFTVDEGLAGNFSGTLTSALTDGKSYDWYANYPYVSQKTSPAIKTAGYVTVGGKAQTQTGNDSKAHLSGAACPLYGVAKNVAAADKPAIVMKNLASVVAIKVTNALDDALTVTSVAFTSTEDIVGTYYIDYSGDAPAYTASDDKYVSSTANLTVSGGTAIAKNASATFYIAIKPHKAAKDSKLTIAVNGIEKTLTLPKDVTFTAGSIKTLKFNYDKAVVKYATIPWSEDFTNSLNTNIYTVSSGTYIYTNGNNLAGGKSAPELLVAKNGGSFTVTLKADTEVKDYILSFLTNKKYDKISVTSETSGVTITKSTSKDGEYSIAVTDAVDEFKLSFTTTSSDNVRLDDISLALDSRKALSAPMNVTASLNTEDATVTNSIDVQWDAVTGAGSYVVTATPASGTAVTKEATGTKSTITGLDYNTEYTITVYAKPSDETTYRRSAATAANAKVTTGAKPSGVASFTRVKSTSVLLAGGTFIIGYEATANSGVIVPMQNTGKATTSTAGYLYSGATESSSTSTTIDMSSVKETSMYEVAIAKSTYVDGAITIKCGDNYLGNTDTKNNCKLFTDESKNTAFTPTVGDNDVFTLTIAANTTYTTLQYNSTSGSTRFAVYKGNQKNVVIYKKD